MHVDEWYDSNHILSGWAVFPWSHPIGKGAQDVPGAELLDAPGEVGIKVGITPAH